MKFRWKRTDTEMKEEHGETCKVYVNKISQKT